MADEATQEGRLITIEISSLDENVLLPVGFVGHEGISTLFSLNLDLVSQKPQQVDIGQMLGQNVTITLRLRDGKQRFFNGFINRFSLTGRDSGGVERFTHYEAQIVPRFWFLTRIRDCRIFQDKTVPEIIKKVLQERGVKDFRDALTRNYTKWDYCSQYRETDFHFLSRIMEEEGIFYFFEHARGKHTLVLADSQQAHKPCPNQSKATFDPVGGTGDREDTINAWHVEQELRSGKYTLRDYHFEMPGKTLEVNEKAAEVFGGNDQLEIYDFPGGYAKKFNKPGERLSQVETEGETIVKLRMEEEEEAQLINRGSSNCRSFAAGTRFNLVSPPVGISSGPYVLTSVYHTATQDSGFVSGAGGSDDTYSNSFSCILRKFPFRPQQLTPKPIIQGPQTAEVVGPAGEEIFVDRFGRVKVQFHWDREGKNDADSSCWVRVGQFWAGKRWGAFFWPRIGQEVIVDFLEGDPDQPIVVGSVYNARQMPPYLGDGPDSKHKNDPKVSGVKSCSTQGGDGFNEIRFDDNKGKEQVFIHAEHQMDVRVKASQRVSVGGSDNLSVGGAYLQKIGKNKDTHVVADMKTYVEGIYAAYAESYCLLKGQDICLKGENEATLIGDQTGVFGKSEVCLVAGDSFIKITPAGIWIKAPMIYLNSGGSPMEKPKYKISTVEDPAAADDSKSGFPSSGGE